MWYRLRRDLRRLVIGQYRRLTHRSVESKHGQLELSHFHAVDKHSLVSRYLYDVLGSLKL